jgi:hypothetical protein
MGSRVCCITLGLALAVGAQPALKQWANAEEYDLGSQALAEPNPDQRIALLRDWIARYPKTEFERERLMSFALVSQQLGNLEESLKRATEALALNANGPSVLLFIAALGPALPAASEAQTSTVADCALKLLSLTLVRKPRTGTEPHSESAGSSASFVDPETQRVLEFIRRLRSERGPLVQADPEVIKRQVAAAALEWAKNKR